MDSQPQNYTVSVDFPGDIEYIPDVRRFISNLVSLQSFSRRFSFRMEIIIDELCSNAIKFGRPRVGEFITLTCRIREDEVELDVQNPGHDEKEIKNLRKAVAGVSDPAEPQDYFVGRGIQIIKILSSSIQVVDGQGTVVRVIKKKNENEEL